MAVLPFLFGGSVSTGNPSHWLVCAVSGIIICLFVYKLTGYISARYFKGYGNLSYAKQVEWKNRGFSTAHALIVSFGSFYLLMLSDLFREDSHDTLIVFRHSTLSDTILGISLGYFLADFAMIFSCYPALGGFEYVIHHALSMYSIFLSLASGEGQFYILMVLFSEFTTPFINLRWYLDVAGQKSSNLYIVNGVALFLGWLVARILLFIYCFTHMFIHFDQVRKIFPLGFYSMLVAPSVLAVMNTFWFWKISKGLVKTLTRAKHSR